jgi:catechol 2,3-dioxygenase-like lactoylglutathione lyase family enzyme
MADSTDALFDVWHVAIPVSRLERSFDFYCGQLGFDAVGWEDYPSRRRLFVAVPGGGFRIELFEPDPDATIRRPDHIAFDCRELEGLRAHMMKTGLEVPVIRTFENGVKFFVLTDPDGLPLEFFQGRAIYEASLSARPAGAARK